MPEPDDQPPAPPPLDITDEEWIAASQSCCGLDPESLRKSRPAEPPRNDANGNVSH